EVGHGDRIRAVDVVGAPRAGEISGDVEQDTAADDGPGGPLVDPQLRPGPTVDVAIGNVVVVAVLRMAHVAEAIPLASTLEPETVEVVVAIDVPGRRVVGPSWLHTTGLVADMEDVMTDRGAPGQLGIELVHREVEREDSAPPDHRRGAQRALVREQVEGPEL